MANCVLRLLPVRYIVVTMGFFGFLINYILRNSINLALVAMVNHTAVNSTDSSNAKDGPFIWDENTVGLILGSFYYGYICTQIVGGRAAELSSVKYIYGVSLLAAGLLTFLIPAAARHSSGALVAVRVVEGFVLGVGFPSCYALLRSWAPPGERSTVTAITTSATNLGTAVAMPLASAIINSLGWEAVFYINGSFAVVWFILWVLLVYNTPEEHVFITEEERSYITNAIGTGRAKKSPPLPWRDIMLSPPVWALIISNFCNNWGFYSLANDLPQYFTNILDKDISSSAVFTSLPFLGTFIVSLAYGTFSDWLLRKNRMSVGNVRRMAQFGAHTLPAVCLATIAFLGKQDVAVEVLLFVGIGLLGCGFSGWSSSYMDIAPNYSGTLYGISNTFGSIPGFVAPSVVGALTEGHETLDRWRWCFLIPAALMVFDTIFFFIFGSAQEQSWNRKNYSAETERGDGIREKSSDDSKKGTVIPRSSPGHSDMTLRGEENGEFTEDI